MVRNQRNFRPSLVGFLAVLVVQFTQKSRKEVYEECTTRVGPKGTWKNKVEVGLRGLKLE